MSIIAVSYPRISSERGDASWSISSQAMAIRKYAEHNGLHLPVEHEFAEEFTGRARGEDRPQLSKILRLVHEGSINAVIIYATDRLARKISVAQLLLDEFTEAGIALHIVAWGRAVTKQDAAQFLFESVISDIERERMLERTTRGRRAKIEGGAYFGSGQPPYGYTVVGEKRDMHLEVIESEREVVAMIYRWYTSGVGVSEICRRLHAQGIASPGEYKVAPGRLRGPNEWTPTTVYAILRDSAYTGRYEFYKKSDKPVTVGVPIIISEDVWRAAQDQLAIGRQRSFKNQIHPYLMARRLTCSCGRAIHVDAHRSTAGRLHLYYFCPTNKTRDPNPACGLRMFDADAVDYEAWTLLSSLIRHPETIRERLKQSQAELEHRNAELRDRLTRIDGEITKQNSKLTFLIDMAAESYANATPERQAELRALYKSQVSVVETTLADLQNERTKIAVQLVQRSISDEYIADWERLHVQYSDKLDHATPEQRRALVEDRNLTGTLAIEDGIKVVYLHLYEHTFRCVVQSLEGSSPAS